MAMLPIRITGDPVLHARAREVEAFGPDLDALIADMVETMHAAPGVGLAAPQVGVPLRLFVWHWTDEDGTLHEGTAINPRLWISPPPVGEPDEDEESEGCLSIPGERFGLRRAEHARLEAVDAAGRPFAIDATGWLARIFQHEFDHLDGVLYADRLREPEAKAVAKAIKSQKWGVPGLSWMPGVDDMDA